MDSVITPQDVEEFVIPPNAREYDVNKLTDPDYKFDWKNCGMWIGDTAVTWKGSEAPNNPVTVHLSDVIDRDADRQYLSMDQLKNMLGRLEEYKQENALTEALREIISESEARTMTLTEYEIHPAANIFPMMDAESFADLKADIDKNGVRECITLVDGKLIDGRNRYKAMRELGIDPGCHAGEMDECKDPIAFVVSLNLHRRHLSASQRAACAADVARLRIGSNQHMTEDGQNCPPSISDAAKVFKVSPSSVKTAKKVLDNGAKEVVALVKSGELPVSVAAEFVGNVHDKEFQSSIAKQGATAVRNTLTVKPTKATHSYICPNCGGHEQEQDDEGSYCKTCQDPVDAPTESQAEINTRNLKLLKGQLTSVRVTLKEIVADDECCHLLVSISDGLRLMEKNIGEWLKRPKGSR